MIVWHGLSDPLPNPVDTIDYYNSIRTRFGHSRRHADKTEEFVRLFLLPNVGHCGGAAPGGPNTWDPLTALEQWVEEGIAPEEIIASRVTDGVVTRTRPICAYPQVARYVGSGSIDDAANFVCRDPRDRDRQHDGRTLITGLGAVALAIRRIFMRGVCSGKVVTTGRVKAEALRRKRRNGSQYLT